MRRYLGFVISIVLSVVLAGVMFALAPKLTIDDDRDSLAHAAQELSDYPFTPLISNVRVFSASWNKWVDEIDTAIKKKKSGGYGDPDKLVESNAAIFRKGKSKIETTLLVLAGATVAAPIVFWLGILLAVKVFPKVEHLRGVAGRVALISFAIMLAGLALPCVVAEDFTGLVFSAPTILGGVVGWAANRKRQA